MGKNNLVVVLEFDTDIERLESLPVGLIYFRMNVNYFRFTFFSRKLNSTTNGKLLDSTGTGLPKNLPLSPGRIVRLLEGTL